MDIYVLTSNDGKFTEISSILMAIGVSNKIIRHPTDITEIQGTSKEILIAKCKEGQRIINNSNVILLIEDTSLYFDAVGGLPGPYVKQFEKSIGNQGLYELTQKFYNPKASAECGVGIVIGNEEPIIFTSKINGSIVEPKGENGIGWDTIFIVDGETRRFSEMSSAEKNRLSPRYHVLNDVANYLKSVDNVPNVNKAANPVPIVQ